MKFTNGTRVEWIHECPMVERGEPCGYNEGGTVWRPHPSVAKGRDDYEVAAELGLTADPKPANKNFAMVAWDCRRGVVQCHYLDELKAIT